MTCPWCGSTDTACRDSRPYGDGRRRRYACRRCGERFSTLERVIGMGGKRGPLFRDDEGTDCHAGAAAPARNDSEERKT